MPGGSFAADGWSASHGDRASSLEGDVSGRGSAAHAFWRLRAADTGCPFSASIPNLPIVCTENQNSGILVVKSTEDRP